MSAELAGDGVPGAPGVGSVPGAAAGSVAPSAAGAPAGSSTPREGASLAFNFPNEAIEKRVRPLAESLGAAVLLGAVGLLLFIRPTTVSTGPDQVALHYSDGAFTPRRFKDCVSSSTRAWAGFGQRDGLSKGRIFHIGEIGSQMGKRPA